MTIITNILTLGMLAISSPIVSAKAKADAGPDKQGATTNEEHSGECKLRALREQAELGEAENQYLLAKKYDLDLDNPVEAVKWYRKAALQGHPEAQVRLGRCYRNGRGVAEDEKEGFKWFLRAAVKGDHVAQFEVAHCYNLGIGVEKNEEEALKWHLKAAAQGNDMSEEAIRLHELKKKREADTSRNASSITGYDVIRYSGSADGALSCMRAALESSACVLLVSYEQENDCLKGKIKEVYKGDVLSGKLYSCESPAVLFPNTERENAALPDLYLMAESVEMADDGTYRFGKCVIIGRTKSGNQPENCLKLLLGIR